VRLQTYSYLPSRKASPPSGWYQIILLGDRGTCVFTTCPGLHSTAGRPAFKLATCWSQVQRTNHSATEPHSLTVPLIEALRSVLSHCEEVRSSTADMLHDKDQTVQYYPSITIQLNMQMKQYCYNKGQQNIQNTTHGNNICTTCNRTRSLTCNTSLTEACNNESSWNTTHTNCEWLSSDDIQLLQLLQTACHFLQRATHYAQWSSLHWNFFGTKIIS